MATTVTLAGNNTRDANEVISFPILTYSDALPRDDLHDISNGIFQEDPRYVTKWKFPRPSNGAMSRQAPPTTGATFDFQLTMPPEEAPATGGSTQSPSGYMIGVALGSPRLLHDQKGQPPPRFNTGIFTDQKGTQTQIQTPAKPSKWKKIGGLFKAKNALEAGPKSKEEKVKKSMSTKQKAAPKKDSLEEWPKLEVDPPEKKIKKKSTKKRRKYSLSEKKAKEDSNGEGPVLDVQIPDVQMERYSVMFSSVMSKNRQPSLLSRRSKTLDSLHVPTAEEFLRGKVPPVPQRRATSPAATNFSLFPTSQPRKAAKVLGTQNFSRGPNLVTSADINTATELPANQASTERLVVPHYNGSRSSLNTPVSSNPFTTSEPSNTPQSNPFLSREEKPLPALKPENPISRPRSRTASQVLSGTSAKRPDSSTPTRMFAKASPAVPTKDSPSRSASPVVSTLRKSSTHEQLALNKPPAVRSPLRTGSPQVRNSITEQQVKMPVIMTEREISPKDISKRTSAVQVSTARSVSVSRGKKKQMLVPVGSRVDQLHAHERYVDRQGALTPQISGGHKYQLSQKIQIESI